MGQTQPDEEDELDDELVAIVQRRMENDDGRRFTLDEVLFLMGLTWEDVGGEHPA